MRAKGARRLVATSAAILMAGGAAIGAAGGTAAAPAVHTHVATSRCFGDDWGCFDHGGFRFGHRFDHGRFDHRFDGGFVVIIVRL
ncbi:hypothetical protein [Streptomyces sp. NPDC005969]|uniref:hypothetical protein n=1 Tax=Streptomyces sp. NPDC005969 TaxID=3156722 RepID=UPI0033D1FC38